MKDEKEKRKVARKIADDITLRERPNDTIVDLEDGTRAIISKERLEECWFKTEEDKEGAKRIIIDYHNKRDLIKKLFIVQPLYYDESKLWWAWRRKEFKWEIVDETDILNFVKELSYYDTIKSKERTEILEALKQEGRLKKPKDIKPTWIQFKDLIIDILTGEKIKASPDYFVTNPVPWSIHKENFEGTPVMDRLFIDWVGEEHMKILYEVISYCLIPNYPIHRLFCIIGFGMNGKSCFLRLLKKFLGEDNVTATELDTLLTSRFEITRLHKKHLSRFMI